MYYNDQRYVNLWIKYASVGTEPLDLYSYMHAQGIGILTASFYIAWSEEYERLGNLKQADAVFQEALKCGAEPLDKLQYYHRGFQARVSRQVIADMASGGQDVDSPEAAPPHRASLVDLKHKGKKKVVVPVIRTGASVSHHGRGLNLQLPGSTQAKSNHRIAVFDENQAAHMEPSRPRSEPWIAPPIGRAKENDLMPEKWNNVKLPQKSRVGYSAEMPPSKPNFQPYVEDCDELPAVTPCKINSMVNNVLSARKPGREESVLARLQVQQAGEGERKEQSMYCKDLLYGGTSEFCFEELRAECFRKKKAKEIEAEEAEIRRRREELRQEIEEKQRLLQDTCLRNQELGLPNEAVQECSKVPHALLEDVIHPQTRDPSTAVEQSNPTIEIYKASGSDVYSPPRSNPLIANGFDFPDDVFVSPSAKEDIEFEAMFLKSDHNMPNTEKMSNKPAITPFTIFDENPIVEEPQKVAPLPSSQATARKPLAAILRPAGGVPPKAATDECDDLEGIEPLNEDAIVSSYRNKTLCPNPDDTCDFMRAAQLASTPFSGGLGMRNSPEPEITMTTDLCSADLDSLKSVTPVVKDAANEEPPRVKQLSPIQEASLEDARYSVSSGSSTSSSVSGQSSVNEMTIAGKLELGQSRTLSTLAEQTSIAHCAGTGIAPSTIHVRKQLLDKLPESYFSQFFRESGPLPTLEEKYQVCLGNDTYDIKREIISTEDYNLYFAQRSVNDKITVIKVDFQCVPWDFYIMTRLKKHLGDKSQSFFGDLCRCYMYEEGCVTLFQGLYPHTLMDILEKTRLQKDIAAFLTVNLLELVEQMHSCGLVHANLSPDTLLLGSRFHETEGGPLNLVDFSHCLDLDFQPEVMSVGKLQMAQRFLKQGLLSETSTPYQLDLLGIADTVHKMLEGRSMEVVREGSEWRLVESNAVPVNAKFNDGIWFNFFKKILNPGDRSSVIILAELREEFNREMKLLSCQDFEMELAFFF
ncbi:mitotic checkpoint serine/threonine-protein kinase BUB1 beta isoform X2 [Amia ocellicauda]